MDTDITKIDSELVKANFTDQVIAKMREDYLTLKVKDIYDKPGFEAVSTARKEAKKFRVSIEKFLKALRAPATDFQKAVVSKEKELVGKIDEIESYLQDQEDIFNQVEPELVTELSDDEKIINYKKALLAVKLPQVATEDATKKLTEIITGLTNLLK